MFSHTFWTSDFPKDYHTGNFNCNLLINFQIIIIIINYSEFCLDELDETHFLHKVAKLNINVIYLCLSQNVNSELLQPKTTLKNLLYLLNQDASLLGR